MVLKTLWPYSSAMDLNLHTAGSGLFETHISWEDIERRIQNERKLKVFFGPRRKVHQIGDGNVSVMFSFLPS